MEKSELKPTRFKNLFYKGHSAKMWDIYSIEEGSERAAWIGPHYSSKAELLADLDRFAKERGYDKAN